MRLSNNKPFADCPSRGAPWFAIHTRYQHENAAARSLVYKGFEVFLPQYTAVRHWTDRTKELSAPLFPCYLFLRGGIPRLNIVTTPGVQGLVGFGGVPATIPDAEIEALRQAVARRVRLEPYPFLKCGDWVRVMSGPLEGIEGILVRNKNRYRLVLSVDLVQKSAAVEVDGCAVERGRRPDRSEREYPFTLAPYHVGLRERSKQWCPDIERNQAKRISAPNNI
jgi:transcription antitermination factor NusG